MKEANKTKKVAESEGEEKNAISTNEQRERCELPRIEEAAFDTIYLKKEQYDRLLGQGQKFPYLSLPLDKAR